MFRGIMIGGVQDTIFAYLRVQSLEHAEVTCRGVHEALADGRQWAECACGELMPMVQLKPALAQEAVVDKREVRRILTALCYKEVAWPREVMEPFRLRDAKDLAEAVERNRRRGRSLSAPGTIATIVVHIFRFRPRAAQPGREVTVALMRHGQEEVWELKMSFPASGGAWVWGRRREETATVYAMSQAPTELYADVFSVGSQCNSFYLVDAHLRPEAKGAKPGFCEVSGAWGRGMGAETFMEGVAAVICFREADAPPRSSRPSAIVQALALECTPRRSS